MKKIVLLVAFCLSIGNVFAQDAEKLRDEGDAALKAKNYPEAVAKYGEYLKLTEYTGEAMAYRNLNKTEEFVSTVEAGLKALPGNANLEKLLYSYCIKQGQAAQKKGDIAGAEALYKNVLIASNKKYQEGALYSLGAMLYNQGATALQKATLLATSEPDKYKAEKAKADAQLKEAKEYLDKALALNPNNANVKKLVDAIAATLQ